MEDFMIRVIPNDFDVEILVNREDACLFYGFRQGHVHFVHYYKNYVVQYHIPRFLLAYNLDFLSQKLTDPEIKTIHTLVSAGFMVTVNSKESLIFQVGNQEFHFTEKDSEEFFSEIHKDIEIYRKATEMLKSEGDDKGCYLEGVELPDKKLLRSDDGSPELLTAIAFEYLTYKNLKTSRSLSIWYLFRDLVKKKYEVRDEWFMELAPGLQYLVEEEKDETIKNIYYKLLEERHLDAFQEDEAVALGNYGDLIFFAYKQLNPVQKIQFKTLINLHGVNFILPLALVTGIIDQRQYNDFVNMGFQPDSKDEQETRYETSVVVAFGWYFK